MDNRHKNTRESCVGNDEVQIEARDGMPLVGDRAFPGTAWYKVDVQTEIVTIHYYEDGEKTEEFDIKEVELSGVPINHDPCASPICQRESKPENHDTDHEDKLRRLSEVLNEAKRLCKELDARGIDWMVLVARQPSEGQKERCLTISDMNANTSVFPDPKLFVNE